MSRAFGPAISVFDRLTQPRRQAKSRSAEGNKSGSGIAMYANGVYYPNWRIYKQEPPSSLNFGAISHVFYAFAWVKPDGTVFLSDEWADTQLEVDGSQGCLRSFAALKQQHSHLKLVLSIGGGGQASQNFATVASNPSTRTRFADSARTLVNQYGFDGIDIDWEHPSDPEQGVNYVHLLSTIRSYLPSSQYIVTSALPAGEWALRNIDLNAAQRYLDLINIMAYDFSGPWVDRSGHHAQLSTPRRPHDNAAAVSCHSAVSYMLAQGVPAQKLLLGIPTYGRSFLGAGNIGQAYRGAAGEEGTFDYKDLPRPGAQEHVDTEVGAAFCVGGDGGFVSYDNPATVRLKASFVKQNGLAGLFYWTGPADAKGPRSLIETGYLALHF